MSKKTKIAQQIINQGSFVIPSPDQIEQAMTPAGAWTANTLAEWGIPWPPKAGWRKDLERRWKAQNDPAADITPVHTRSNEEVLKDHILAALWEVTLDPKNVNAPIGFHDATKLARQIVEREFDAMKA